MVGTGPTTRRAFMKTALFATAFGGISSAPGCLSAQRRRDNAPAPNIVFIIADDIGWADLGYAGSRIRTPNIDRLAAEGVRLNQHYATPTCTPTRVAIMTGRFPSRYGVLAPAYGSIFHPDTVTLPEALRRSGYRTATSGKWHMGSPPDCIPTKYGFTSSYGYLDGQIDPYTHLYKNGRQSWHRNDVFITEQGHATDLITDEAVRQIRTRAREPLFLYVAYSVPHFPLDEPDRWLDMYPDIDEPSRRLFAASITHMDDGIGQIVKALDETGLRRNTLIVFISDNGGQRSWHSATEYGGQYADRPHTVLGDNRPLRGWKGDVFEGGIRARGLLNWPDTLRPGQMDEPMHVADWMPTLCAAAALPPDDSLPWDGKNVWPIITGRSPSVGERTLYWKTPNAYALRMGDWKLITDRNMAKPMLFDLRTDPLETNDLAKTNPQTIDRLMLVIRQIAAADRRQGEIPDSPPPAV